MSDEEEFSLDKILDNIKELESIDNRVLFYDQTVSRRLDNCINSHMEDLDKTIVNMLQSIDENDLRSLGKFLIKFSKQVSYNYDSFIKSSIRIKSIIDKSLSIKDSSN